MILFDTTAGAKDYTLPPASKVPGHVFAGKKINSGGSNATINTNGSETIDGASDYVLSGSGKKAVILCCDGTAWYILSES